MWPFGHAGADERIVEIWGQDWETFSVEGTGQRKDADTACAMALAKAARTLPCPVFVIQHRPYGLDFEEGWYHGTVEVRVFWPMGSTVDSMLAASYETGSVADYIQYRVPFMDRLITETRATKIREWYWWGDRDKTARIWRVNMDKRPVT
jgi:hypothetical protein